MEQYMYVQLDGGQVVQVSDSVVDGSFEIRPDQDTRTFVVQEELNPDGTEARSHGRSSIHGTRDINDQVFYIVQQEGSNLDGNTNILTIPQLNNNTGTESTSQGAPDNLSGTSELGFQDTSSNTVIIATENQGTESQSVELSFHCQFCGDVFLLQDWHKHLQDEHGITEIGGELSNSEVVSLLPTCSICSKTFLNEEELTVHKKEHSSDASIVRMRTPCTKLEEKELTHSCKICYKIFNDKTELKKHLRESHPDKFTESSDQSSMFAKCPYCHKMFIQRGNNKALINHIYMSHPGKDVDCLFREPVEEKVKCIFCDLQFVWTKSVIRHMKASHPTEFLEQEDFILSSLDLMDAKTSTKKHRRSVKDLEENDSGLFRCKLCSRQFLWDKTLKRHVQEIHDNLEESVDKKPARKKSQGAVVFCCPYCDLVSKYACAVRKHVERKHPEKVEGINVNKMEVPTMEADNVANKLKTVDKRPLELRSDFFPVIFRCPFCSYASNQGSNLIRHLTSIKHGNIFSADEMRQIKVSSFKVRQKLGGDLMKVDGTPQRSLPKLRLKGHVLSLVMEKYEILKQTKKEEKENENNEKGDEQYSEMNIENIIDMAENETDESFDEQDDEEFEMRQPRSSRTNSAHLNKKVGQNLPGRANDKINVKMNEDSLDEESNMDAEAETLELNEDIEDEDDEPLMDNEESIESQQMPTIDDQLNRMSGNEAGMQSDREMHSAQKDRTESSLDEESYEISSNSKDSGTRQEHRNENQNDKGRTLICIGCKKEFMHFDEFKSHLSTHVNLKVEFTCTECGDKFSLWKDLQIHADNEHTMSYTSPNIELVTLNVVKMNSKPLTTFDCPYCEMLFSQCTPLESHIIMDHSDFIQSACIKQEPGTPRRKSGIMTISRLDCQFCECYYTSVTDIVKHMFVIHKDVDKSALLNVDNSGVRKSGRKRKAPKWLEEESQTTSKSKVSKSVRVVESEIKSTNKNSSETANSGHLKDGQKENLKCTTVNTRKQTKEAVVETCSPKKAINLGEEDSMIIKGPKRSEKAVKQKPKLSKAQQNLTSQNENTGSVEPSIDVNKCPHCDFVAKRSSALAFHINFNHSNIKVKQELVQCESPSSKNKPAGKNMKKTSELNLQANRKSLFKNRTLKDSAESEEVSVEVESDNSKPVESDPNDDYMGEKNIPDQDRSNLNEGDEESPAIEIGNDSDMLDEAAEFGDSDDDFRPGSDDEDDDGDSDLDDLTDEDDEGFSLSILIDCPYCTTDNFDVFSNLEEHVKANHPEKADSFSIAEVNTRVALDGTLKTPNMIHTCNYCKKMFFGKSKLRAHVKNTHEKKSTADKQRKHKARNSKKINEVSEEFYKCPFCTVLTHLQRDIQLHARQHHGQEIGSIEKYKFQEKETVETTYKCPFCETRSVWKNCLLRHVSRSHSDQVDFEPEQVCIEIVLVESKDNKGTLFQCVYCSWQCERKREVLNHINDMHPSEPEVSLEDIQSVAVDSALDTEDCFQCPYCELRSKYKRCVIRHVSRSHKEKKGFTKHDVIILSRKGGRNIDRRQGRMFRCLYCPAESLWKSCVVQHIQNEHPEGSERNITQYHLQEGAHVDLDNLLFNTNDADFKYFRCSYCDVISESRKGIVEHASDVHVQEPQLQSFDIQEVDWNRAESIGEDYVFQCPITQCHSTSTSRKRVVQHVRATHTSFSTFTIPVVLKSGPKCQSALLCKLCNELCHSEVEIAMHARDVHGNEEHVVLETVSKITKLTNIFSCPYCEHTSNMRKAIVKHVEVYHSDKRNFQASDVGCAVINAIDDEEKTGGFQCPYCNTVNHWKKSIIRHMKTVHPDMPCNIDIEFNPNVNIKDNSKSARKSSKQINCLRCGTTCRSMEKMKKHFEAEHPMFAKNFLSKENTQFAYNSLNTQPLENVCVLCNARYMWKKSLLVHIKRRHKDVSDVYQVLDEVLDTISANTEDLVPDQTTLHASALSEQTNNSPQVYKKPVYKGKDKSLLQCRTCHKTFNTIWALKVHNKIIHLHKRQNRFPCGRCGITFPTKTLHRQHKARFHQLQNPAVIHCSVAGCDYRCRFSHKLRNHYKNVHGIQKPTLWKLSQCSESQDEIRCEICSRTFTSPRMFAAHLLVHKKKGKLRIACNFCGKQFKNREERDAHIEFDHKDKIEMCDICGALCAKSKLQQHTKSHGELQSTRVECPYCHKSVNERLLNRHAMMYHTDILNCGCVICTSSDNEFINTGFYCATCGDTFCQKIMLDIHTKLQHDVVRSTSKYYFCELCPDVYFLSKHLKNVHCHEHHRRKALPSQPMATPSVNNEAGDGGDEMTHVIHIGQDEGKQFLPKLSEASMNAVIKELLVVERGALNPYKCLLCNRSFSKSKYIKLHIRRAHVKDEDQPYRCKLCGSGFVRLTEFRKHSRAHSDFRPYKCRYCDRAFKQQANLRDHYRIHTMNKEYECYICKTEFRQRGGLTSHVVFHDTLKPFKCMFCEKGFTTRGELSRHMQKYNKDMGDQAGEKMYPCHLCDKTYTHYPVLLKHIETHNPEKPFKCSACEEKFSNYVAMYFHKVREEHFLLEEIQQGLKDLQKKGRKFRAKKRSQGQMLPQVILESNQATETIYVSRAGASEGNEANVKPVEVIIEELGREQQVVRVQENEPEHEELLSIAKQLTELSGFTEGEYYTTKKTNHQEEDEIIKTMLDADEEVLANLSKQSVARLHLTEYEKFVAKEEGMENIHNVQNDQQNEDFDNIPGVENDGEIEDGHLNNNGLHVTEANGVAPVRTLPTNMEELVNLVAQTSSSDSSEQIVAIQNEDGSVIYVCLKDDANKTEVISDNVIDEYGETVQNPDILDQEVENTEDAEMEVETNEEIVEDGEEEDNFINNTNQETENQTEEFIPQQNMELPTDEPILEEVRQQQETKIESPHVTVQSLFSNTPDQQNLFSVANVMQNLVKADSSMVQQVEMHEIQLEANHIINSRNTPETILAGQEHVIGNNSQITSFSGTTSAEEGHIATTINNLDYNVEEPMCDKIVIPPHTQQETVESQEELIKRSQLAQHLTGKIQPFTEPRKIHTRAVVTKQGLKVLDTESEPVTTSSGHTDNISQTMVTIAAAAASRIQDMSNNKPGPSNSGSIDANQGAFDSQDDSYIGEDSVEEYHDDESTFIKEELLNEDYTGANDKGREIMFVSDNIYTYSETENKFICLHCGTKVRTFKNLKSHIRRHAPETSRFHKCSYCAKRFVTKNELKRHLWTHTGERNYACKYCGKRFIQPGHLQEHVRVHTGFKPFSCSVCNTAFNTKSQLVLHWSRKHSDNEVPCNQCDKIFKNQVDLKRHQGMEHSSLKGRTTRSKTKLEDEGGDHVCEICGQSFGKIATLKRHLEKHNLEDSELQQDDTRYMCEECGVSFKSKYYVKEHMKSKHSEERNEACPDCTLMFKTKIELRKHRETIHREKESRWQCKHCDKVFSTKYALGYHMGANHMGETNETLK